MSLFRSAMLAALMACSGAAFADRGEPHNYDLQDVTWRMSYDSGARTIRGEVTNTLTLKARGDTAVVFDCGPLTIDRVTVDGTEAGHEWQNDKLSVSLPRPARVGQKVKIKIAYRGAPTAGVYFVDAEHAYPAKTGMVYTQGEAEDTRFWLPTYDFPDDKATAECFIEVPAGQFALSNGKLLGIDKKSSAWTYHWRISRPISTYLISFVAGDYHEGRESLGSLPVLWYVPKGTERWGEAAFGGTNKMIDLFNKLTGFNYPFEKFSQSAVADFMFGGMENASCVTQTINCLHKPENQPIASAQGLVAHELAHQWFGDTVTCADWSHAWINEGFASFLPSFWFRKTKGEDDYDAGRVGTFNGALASQASTKRPVVSNRYEVPMDLFDGQVYGGGAARLFTLMHQVGEKPFWQGVKQFLNEYKFKNVTTEDFFAVMSRVTKRDLSAFRDQYFYSSAVPACTVARRGSDVVITQQGSGVDLDLKLYFLGRDEVEKVIPVQIHGRETVVPAVGLERHLVVLDYPVTAMLRIDYAGAYSSDDLLRIYRLSPNAAAKITALDRFGTKMSETDLLDVARAEKSRPVLDELLPKLKRGAVPYLVQLSRGFNRQTAYTAINALGNFANDPQARDRLTEIWTRESNEYLRNSALQSLLKLDKSGDLAKDAWSRESQGEMFRISALRWWSEHEPASARKRALDILAGPPSEPLKIEAIRQLSNLKDAPGEHRVFDVLMKLAEEPSYASRMAAVDALANYGDKRAVKVIEPLTKSSLFFTRRAAARALAKLR